MVNTNIEFAIPVNGKGFVSKLPSDNWYASGEFAQMRNCEVLDNRIQRRRPFTSVSTSGVPINKLLFFEPVSYKGEHRLYFLDGSRTNGTLKMTTGSGITTLVNNIHTPFNAYGAGTPTILDVIVYNDVIYAVYVSQEGTTALKMFLVDITSGTIPAAYTLALDTTMTAGANYSYGGGTIFKDRYWLALGNTIYFSKATDPKVYTVPEGGFFKIVDDSINYILAYVDAIYIFCDNSVYVLSYVDDPNANATIRRVSQGIPAKHACVYENSIYFINDRNVYVINNNFVEKVLSVEFNLGLPSPGDCVRLTSFGIYLIVQRGFKTTNNYGPKYHIDTPVGDSGLPSYWINMETGAVHYIDVDDSVDVLPTKAYKLGSCVSIGQQLYYSAIDSVSDTESKLLLMGDEILPQSYDEFALDVAGALGHYYPKRILETKGIVPSGNRNLIKKFRSLSIEAQLPKETTDVYYAVDNSAYANSRLLSDVPASGTDVTRFPYSHRVGLNQRGRSINFKIESQGAVDPDTGSVYSPSEDEMYNGFNVSDMRIFWAYSNRAPK